VGIHAEVILMVIEPQSCTWKTLDSEALIAKEDISNRSGAWRIILDLSLMVENRF
jgi:hypothetical protein